MLIHHDHDSLLRDFRRWGFDRNGWSENTRDQYARRIRQADRWLHDTRRICIVDAEPTDYEAFLFDTAPSARNRNHIRHALMGFGRFLTDTNGHDRNPAGELPSLPVPDSTPEVLTIDQARRLREAADAFGPRSAALIDAFLFLALRRAEAQHLEWRNIQTDWVKVTGKGDRDRTVPLHPKAAETIERWRSACPHPRWMVPSPRRHDRPLGSNTVYRIVREVGFAAGIHALHPHVLRHTAATRMLEQGYDIRVVQEFLGHRRLATTQIYTRVRPVRLTEAVNGLDF